MLTVALAWAESPDPATPNTAEPTAANSNPAAPEGSRRIREGTEIVDLEGHFQVVDNRVTFLARHGNGRFVALENLNLERIGRLVRENPTRLHWSVTGTMTEYRGANYLLIRRAVLRKRSSVPGAAL
ncbi:MAG: hypothetical protein A2V70_09945 [Planctomycetes bacterium RBG_13_63_9]|nr:MAG: hypothetical protein A2V70_09945 [Planctomycetes bacterium RBG_13_63_9]